jgi:hypothetical protein
MGGVEVDDGAEHSEDEDDRGLRELGGSEQGKVHQREQRAREGKRAGDESGGPVVAAIAGKRRISNVAGELFRPDQLAGQAGAATGAHGDCGNGGCERGRGLRWELYVDAGEAKEAGEDGGVS